MERKKAILFINEKAGTGFAARDLIQIVRRTAENGYEPVIYPIAPKSGLTPEELLEQYDGEVSYVLCRGGDGTLNHLMSTVMTMKHRPVIGYLPAGSTNDFAKSLGIPADFKSQLEIALNGNDFAYDVGKMNDRYFNYVAAFGAFAKVSYDTSQELKNAIGYAAYILSAAGQLHENIRMKIPLTVEADGCREDGEFLFGAVANSVSVGGLGLFEKANVKLNDGKMELLLVRTPKNVIDLQSIIGALTKGVTDNPFIVFKRVSKVKIHTEKRVNWSLDGEYGGTWKDVLLEVQKQAVVIKSGIMQGKTEKKK